MWGRRARCDPGSAPRSRPHGPRRRTAWPSRSAREPGRRAPPPHEHDEPLRAPDPGAAVGERVDRDLDLLPLAGPRALRCGGFGHADYARRLRADRPRRLPRGGRGVPVLDRPRVLPALLGTAGRLRDRADLRPPRRAVLARGGRRPARDRCAARASRVRRPGPDRPRDEGRARPSWRGARPRSSSNGTASRCPTARPRWCRPTSPTPDRRAALEEARNAALASELNPLSLELLERSHELARELGWPSMRALCEELSATDLGALSEQTESFLAATADGYERAGGARAAAASSGSASTASGAPTWRPSSAPRHSTRAFRRSGSCRR